VRPVPGRRRPVGTALALIAAGAASCSWSSRGRAARPAVAPDAVQEVRVGDGRVEWHSLPAGSDEKRVYLEQGGQRRDIGRTTEEITIDRTGEAPVLTRVQRLESPELGAISVRLRLHAETFEPIELDAVLPDATAGTRTIGLRYDGRRVAASASGPAGDTVRTTVQLAQPAFDAYSIELILRLLPLREEYAARFPVYSQRSGLRWVTARVVGSERVSAGGGRTADAWVVETDFGDSPVRYWIGKFSPELLKQLSEVAPGMRITFER